MGARARAFAAAPRPSKPRLALSYDDGLPGTAGLGLLGAAPEGALDFDDSAHGSSAFPASPTSQRSTRTPAKAFPTPQPA